MRDGFLRVAVGTPQVKVADCRANTVHCASLMSEAAKVKAHLLVLPELCLTGATCGDLFFQYQLLDTAVDALLALAEHSRGLALLTFVGLPLPLDGKLYNCAAAFYDGVVLGLVPQTHVPGPLSRYFASGAGKTAMLTMEDRQTPFGADLLFCPAGLPSLVAGVDVGQEWLAQAPPSQRHAAAGATLLVNLSATAEHVGLAARRRQMLAARSRSLRAACLYAGAGYGESTSDGVYAGARLIAENGVLLAEAPLYSAGLTVTELDTDRLEHERRRCPEWAAEQGPGHVRVGVDLPEEETPLSRPVSKMPFVPQAEPARTERCEELINLQAHALVKRLTHVSARTAVVGVSGGLDSTLALLVTVRAFDLMGKARTDITAVTLPGFGTGARTYQNARKLTDCLGVTLREVDIRPAVELHFKDIGHDRDNTDVVFENAQARERMQILMDIANGEGGLVVGTGDLSELALGWCTFGGDHLSMYSVNAGVPKTLIAPVLAAVAGETPLPALRDVLLDIVGTPVSPELLPAGGEADMQKTEALVGPYELHDFFLYYTLRWGFSPGKILRLALVAFADACPREEILSWMKVFYKRFFAAQFKRSCLPDGPAVGSVSLSPRGGWCMPSDACAALWLEELENM